MKLISIGNKHYKQENFDDIPNDITKTYTIPSYCDTAKKLKKKNPKSAK